MEKPVYILTCHIREDMWQVVFSDEEVGIDVEQIRKGQMKVAERFFCPEEYLALQKGKNEKSRLLFYRVMDKKRKLYQSGWKRDGIGSCIVLCTAGSG